MKRTLQLYKVLITCLALGCSLAWSNRLNAQEPSSVNMPDGNGADVTQEVTGKLNFYDAGGPEKASTAYWRISLIRFKPSVESKKLTIDFSSVDIPPNSNAELHIYDGDVKLVEEIGEEEDEISLPREKPALTLKKGSGPVTFTATNDKGIITVVFDSKSNGGTNWGATVSEPKAGPMTYLRSAFAKEDYSIPVGKKSAVLLQLAIYTEANDTPLSLSNIKLEGISHKAFSNFRVITGKSAPTAFNPSEGAIAPFTLSTGENIISILADVSPSEAKAGDKQAVELKNITLSDDIKTMPSPVVTTLKFSDVINMEAPSSAYIIGEPMNFYDDGGPTGKITMLFDGSTTFYPEKPGEKVSIEFTSLKLFESSSTGMNDELNVYNGTEATNANLIANYLKDKGISYSTSADGALTVTLKSKAKSYTKDGFEAIVRSKTPKAMTFKSLAFTPIELKTPLSAISQEAEIAKINVTTEFNEPALQLQKLIFAVSGVVKELALFANDGTGAALGRAQIAKGASECVITLAQPLVLVSGKNIFTIKATIEPLAASNDQYDIVLLSVRDQADATLKAPENSTHATGTIDNTVRATIGKQEATLHTPWNFTHEAYKYAPSEYDPAAGERIVTFTTPAEDKVVKMDFSLFKINFANYGPEMTFIIYDGDNDKAPELWRMTRQNYKEGPKEFLLSSGKSMTVKINFNGGARSKGFLAKVESASVPAYGIREITQIEQGESTISFFDTGNADVARLTIKKVAHAEALTFESFELATKGMQHAVEEYYLYHLAADGEKLIATTKPSEAASVKFAITEGFSPIDGDNNFLLRAKPNSAATESGELSFAFTKVSFKKNISFDVPTPATAISKRFERVVMQHTTDEVKSYTVPQDGFITYTDEGGPEGAQQKEAYSSTTTFLPSKSGEIVRFDFSALKLDRKIKLQVYKGKEIAEDNLIAQIGYSYESNPLWSSLESGGAITVRVEREKVSYPSDGWNIKVTSIVPSKRILSATGVNAIADGSAMLGSTDLAVIGIALVVKGEKDTAKYPDIAIATKGVEKAKLFFAGVDSVFSPTLPNIAGVAGNEGEILFKNKESYSGDGKIYLFVAVDPVETGKAGDKVSVELRKVGEQIFSDTKTTLTLAEGMKGEYTFGADASSNYGDFKKLQEDLGKGISGNVTIIFEPGTYEGNLTIENIPGASANNRLTFKSKNGKAEEVTISPNPKGSAGGYNVPKGVVTISATPYVTFEGITFQMKKKHADAMMTVTRRAHFFTLRNCTFDLLSEPISNYSQQFSALSITGGETNNSQTDFATIENNRFLGGKIAVEIGGLKNIKFRDPHNMLVRNNTFENQYAKSFYTSSSIANLVFEGNNITNDIAEKGFSASIWLVDVVLAKANERIVGNRIYTTRNNCISGLYLRKTNGRTYSEPSLVANNSIVMTAPVAKGEGGARWPEVIGINANDKTPLGNLLLVFNTVRLELGEGNNQIKSIPLALRADNTSIVRNNLLQSTIQETVVNIYGSEIPKLDHNAYYAIEGGNFNIADEKDLSFGAWKGKSDDKKSLFLKAEFIDGKSGVLSNGSLFHKGVPVEGVKTDITGRERSTKNPTMGAYEYIEDSDLELKLNDIIVVADASSAAVRFSSERSAKLYYLAKPSTAAAPTKEELLKLEPHICPAGEPTEVKITGLDANQTYTLYGVLAAISEDKQTAVLRIVSFETRRSPTVPATFDDVKDYEEGKAFEDGTMRFTGFKIVKEGTNGMAELTAKKSIIELTNTVDGLEIVAMQLRGEGVVKATTNSGKSIVIRPVKDELEIIGLKKLGTFHTLTLEKETGKRVVIDNFAFTPSEPKIAPISTVTIAEGEKAQIRMTLTNAAAPYKVVVKDGDVETAIENSWSAHLNFDLKPYVTTEYTATLTDALGREAQISFVVLVNPIDGKASMADFEKVLPDVGVNYRYKRGFHSGSFYFPIEYMAKPESWSGFAMSRSTATGFENFMTDQFNVPSGKGAESSKAFGIAYSFGESKPVVMSEQLIAQKINGLYVSITSWTKSHVVKGDDFFPGFKDGNFYSVIIKGDNGKSVEVPIADYREGKREILEVWTWVDLTSLGEIKSLTFTPKGNATNNYGLVTPAYLAIDNINDPTPNATGRIIEGVKPEIKLAGKTLVIDNAKGVLVGLYDLSGRLVYQVRSDSEHFTTVLDLPEGSYVMVCAGVRAKVVMP